MPETADDLQPPDELADDVTASRHRDDLRHHAPRRRGRPRRAQRTFAEERIAASHRVAGKTLGIVGLGGIGQRAAKLAQGVGMKVIYTGRKPNRPCPYALEPDLLALAERCDVLALSCTATEDTRHLVNARVLEKLLAPTAISSTCRAVS